MIPHFKQVCKRCRKPIRAESNGTPYCDICTKQLTTSQKLSKNIITDVLKS